MSGVSMPPNFLSIFYCFPESLKCPTDGIIAHVEDL